MPEIAKLRDTPIEPEEFAKLEKARRTTDPRKLAAMMPTWLKRHIAAGAPPKRPVVDSRVVLPNFCTRQTDPRACYVFPLVDTMAEYVREFVSRNNLRPADFKDPAQAKPKRQRGATVAQLDYRSKFSAPQEPIGNVSGSIAALRAHATRTAKALTLATGEDRAALESRKQGFEARIARLQQVTQQEAA